MMSITWWNCGRTSPPLALIHGRPRNGQGVACAAEVRRDLLGPLEGGVHRVGPGGREVTEGVRAAELVHAGVGVLERNLDVVEEGHLVEQAVGAALGAGAVVTHR